MEKILLTLLASSCAATAQLVWENAEQAIPPNTELPTTVVTFKFKNTGKEAIRIGEIKTSCKCVTTVLEKMDYGPDESGQLVMTIDRRGRTGNQTESARGKTSDGKETMLVMRIETARFLGLLIR